MAATQWDIIFERGSDWRPTLYITQNNRTYKLENYEASLKIFDKPGGQLLYQATTSNGGITIYGNEGRIQPVITAVDIADFTWTRAYHEFNLAPVGQANKWFKGGVRIVD